MIKKIIIGLILIFGIIGAVPRSQAIENLGAFTITNFKIDILVKKDSTLEVEEVIDVNFSEKRHGIFREIPVKYKDDQGFQYNMKLEVLAVEDQDGADIEYQLSNSSGDKVLKIGDPNLEIIGNQRYVIKYEVKKGMRYFDDHDEIYWNPIGTGWPTRIYNASSVVRFEDGVDFIAGSGLCFTGVFGSKAEDCSIIEDASSGEVEFIATNFLKKNEGLTVAVSLPKGAVVEPTRLDYFILFLKDNYGLCLPIIIFFGMFSLWKKKGQEINIGKTIISQYEAPDDLTPGEVGYLLKESYLSKFLTADIINLAVKGYLEIYEIKKEGALKMFAGQDYELKKIKEWQNLRGHEKELLRGLFAEGSKNKVKLSDRKDTFYKNVVSASAELKVQIERKNYFEKSLFNNKIFYAFGAMFGSIFICSIGVVLERLDMIAGAVLSIPIIIIFGIYMSKKTAKGAEIYWKTQGYKNYIDVAEKHRAEFNAKENIFEKHLPYAMVFGNIDKWAKAFEGISKKQPDWYHSDSIHTFSPVLFASSINKGFMSATQAASASPSSSGSGGSGSSGGGGGGGGGGSW